MIRRHIRSWILLACAVLLREGPISAQPPANWGVPAQTLDPLPPWPDSGVTLQGIQPFDPYATTAPGLPPPLTGPASAYPAPLPPYGPALPPVAPAFPPYPGSVPGNVPPSSVGGPYQPAFNFQGGGLYGGFQGAFLEPRFGNYAINSARFSRPLALSTTTDHDFAFSPRFIVGFEGPQGLGVRGRWWHFDDSASGVGTIALSNPDEVFVDIPTTTSIELDSIDLEMTQDGRFHNWEFLVSGGFRYAQLESLTNSTWESPPNSYFQAATDFDGVGPTLGFSARRAMRQWEGLTFVMNSRFTFLFGDVQVEHTSNLSGADLGPFTVLEVEDVMPAWELQIGAQWTRRLNTGATFYLGAFFEAQLWDWVSPSLINSDLGFWGPTFAIGFSQ